MSRSGRQNDRLQIPFMLAFREAFEKRDAAKAEDIRVDGERVLADRGLVRRGANAAVLKRDLAVDLASLVDTIDLASSIDLSKLPYIAKSVLNYGIEDISSIAAESEAVDKVGAHLKAALLHHEPRLIAETLSVQRTESGDDAHQRIQFKVRADLLCRPLDIPIEFVAEVDITSGKVLPPRLPGTT